MRFLFPVLILMSNLLYAEDSYQSWYDSEEMRAARHALKHHHGAENQYLILGERVEYQTGEGEPHVVWEGQGWYGGDINKFWLKTEGEFSLDHDELEEIEIQALYSRAVSAFWDMQVGLRHDFKPNPSRTFAVFGFQGLAPYWFEIDTTAFISHKGDVSARLEAEYELLLTQRLILQPRMEMNLAFTDDEPLDRGSGINDVDIGLRLRYEIMRELAPYIGVNWHKSIGQTGNLIKQSGGSSGDLSFVAGLRFWY